MLSTQGGLQDVFSGVIESYLISDPVSLDVAYDDLVDVSENLLPLMGSLFDGTREVIHGRVASLAAGAVKRRFCITMYVKEFLNVPIMTGR